MLAQTYILYIQNIHLKHTLTRRNNLAVAAPSSGQAGTATGAAAAPKPRVTMREPPTATGEAQGSGTTPYSPPTSPLGGEQMASTTGDCNRYIGRHLSYQRRHLSFKERYLSY